MYVCFRLSNLTYSKNLQCLVLQNNKMSKISPHFMLLNRIMQGGRQSFNPEINRNIH